MPGPANPSPLERLADDDVAAIDRLRETYARLRQELGRVIVGQQTVVERLAICLFARGHALLMGVPGLAKTLLVSKLSETMSLRFNRIQFTPDLMPMDITGTDILQEGAGGRREFQFVPGPVFANIVLADEINRAPPKTQAAMLEAMQEHRVTVVGKTFTLDQPFLVDICHTNHAEADQDDMDTLLTLLGVAGCNYIMGVPGADDVMLNYQSTSFHDAQYIRRVLNRRPAPEFEAWLIQQGIQDESGTLLPLSSRHPLLTNTR
jgi:hypothetical protein